MALVQWCCGAFYLYTSTNRNTELSRSDTVERASLVVSWDAVTNNFKFVVKCGGGIEKSGFSPIE